MIRIVLSALLLALLALTAHAGETIIKETETGIVVEYTPSEEESKAAATEREVEQKKQEVEEAKEVKREKVKERDEVKKARREEQKRERGEDRE